MNWPVLKINRDSAANCKVSEVHPQLPAFFLPKQGIILTSCQKEFFLNQRAHFPRYLQSFKTLILACEKREFIGGALGT